jgi:hypothetical protein
VIFQFADPRIPQRVLFNYDIHFDPPPASPLPNHRRDPGAGSARSLLGKRSRHTRPFFIAGADPALRQRSEPVGSVSRTRRSSTGPARVHGRPEAPAVASAGGGLCRAAVVPAGRQLSEPVLRRLRHRSR